MTKEEAVAYLMEIDFATRDGVTNAEVQAAIAAELDKRSDKPAKVAKATTTKAPKAKKSTPSLDAIKARASVKAKVPAVDAALEDAPF